MSAWFLDLSDLETKIRRSAMQRKEGRVAIDIPWSRDDCAIVDRPALEDAIDAGFEAGREGLFDLPFITAIITFCHGGLVEVREQWREPLDIVVRLLQQLGDSNRVVKIVG